MDYWLEMLVCCDIYPSNVHVINQETWDSLAKLCLELRIDYRFSKCTSKFNVSHCHSHALIYEDKLKFHTNWTILMQGTIPPILISINRQINYQSFLSLSCLHLITESELSPFGPNLLDIVMYEWRSPLKSSHPRGIILIIDTNCSWTFNLPDLHNYKIEWH